MKNRSAFLTAFSVALLALGFSSVRANALEIKRMTLSNGAVLLVSEQHQLPMVTVAIAFDAGSRRDPKGKEGLAQLTASCLSQGTKKLTAAEFNQKTDFMGSEVGVGASRDYATASMTSLKKYEDQTFGLLAEILTQPGLRTADIERKRAEQVATIKAQEEQPGYVSEITFTKKLYGDTPYGHPSEGYSETVTKLTPADVLGFYNEFYKTGGAVIAVAGDVNADEIKTKVEKELAGLKGTVPAQTPPPPITVAPGLHLDLIDRNVAQANIVLGFGGVARSDPNFYRLQVMNYILGGGGFASRLMREVRSKHGLAYSIGSGFDAAKFPGSFRAILQTKNQSANEAIKEVLQQIREIQEQPVAPDEIDSAKKFLVGSFPLKFDRLSSIAGFMLQVEQYGLGLDYPDRYPKLIDQVTREDVLAAAKKHLHPDAAILVVVANQHEADVKVASVEQPPPKAH